MIKINTSIITLALASSLVAGTAVAQEQDLITVFVGDLAPQIAEELNVDIEEIPSQIDLPFPVAIEACGLDRDLVGAVTSCDALSITDGLSGAIEAQIDDDGEDNGTPSANSARDFAPGHQGGPANQFAPGQQDGPANQGAPGQLKKNTPSDTDGGE